MKAMIFAAGLGTRLKPLTDNKPKALVEYNGKPLIRHAIEYLIKYGVHQIIINTHHFSHQLIQYINNHNFDADISISDETDELLNTGGGLKKAAYFFDDNHPFIVLNTDIITTLNLHDMLAYHQRENNDITLAVRDQYRSRYLIFDDNNQLCGKGNDETSEVILPRATTNVNKFRFSGIHIIEPAILETLPKEKTIFPILEWYMNICLHNKIGGFDHSEDDWKDVGRLSQLIKNQNI